MKETLQSRFHYRVGPYLSNSILSPSAYGTIIKSLHTKTVSNSKSLLTDSPVLQTASPQIVADEANPPRSRGAS